MITEAFLCWVFWYVVFFVIHSTFKFSTKISKLKSEMHNRQPRTSSTYWSVRAVDHWSTVICTYIWVRPLDSVIEIFLLADDRVHLQNQHLHHRHIEARLWPFLGQLLKKLTSVKFTSDHRRRTASVRATETWFKNLPISVRLCSGELSLLDGSFILKFFIKFYFFMKYFVLIILFINFSRLLKVFLGGIWHCFSVGVFSFLAFLTFHSFPPSELPIGPFVSGSIKRERPTLFYETPPLTSPLTSYCM